MKSKFVLCTLVILTTHTLDLYAASEKEIQAELDRLYHSIDLEKIDKVIPKEREYTEKESKSFIDEDGDGAEDRLERLFMESRVGDERRKERFRYILIKNFIVDSCLRKYEKTLSIKKLYATYFLLEEALLCNGWNIKGNLKRDKKEAVLKKLSQTYVSVMKSFIPKRFYSYMSYQECQEFESKNNIYSFPKNQCRY